MLDFNKRLEQLVGLTGNEFVYGVVAYIAFAVAVYLAAQVTIFALSGSVESHIEYGGYSIYPVEQLVSYYPNVMTEFLAKYGVF